MEQIAAELLPLVRVSVVATFVVLALVAVVRAPRTGSSGWWVAGAFTTAALALGVTWLPNAPGRSWLDRLVPLLVIAFPYLLLRFTASFRALPRWLEVGAAVATISVVLANLLLPIGGGDDARPVWTTVYIVAVLGYWVAVSLVTVGRLWRAGRDQPTVARRRMRLMSGATAALTVVLLTTTFEDVLIEFAAQVAILVSAATFGLGFAPPRVLRRSWRGPEERRLQQGTVAVLRAQTIDAIADALLRPTVRIVGGAGAVLLDAQGDVVASHGQVPETDTDLTPNGEDAGARAREVVPLDGDHGSLVVWTSPYTPFFGREETSLVHTMAAVASLALDRHALLEAERSQRAVLEEAQQAAEQARTEAERANLAKSDFMSRMSHELRTPLNAILGFSQLLELSSLEENDRDSVSHILKAGRHLLALINDVLDLSRIEAGTLTISVEPVHTGQLIEDSVALIRPLADSRSIRVTTDDHGCGVFVSTDRQRCRQALLNLLSNAVKYNRDHGEVAVRCSATDGRMRISVSDTGPGITAARRAKLFEPFERLGAESTTVEGTGLGLALTKQLVERLGGAIGVESAPGEGSTFWLDLPVTDRPAGSGEAPSRPAVPSSSDERTLLLVEDNVANLQLVEAILRRRPGTSVLPAMQGHLAIELAREHRPDVIVLDLHLPDISGRDVLHRLKADPRTQDIPIVIASADASPSRVRQLLEDGAADYVTKPLDLARFLEVIDAALAAGERPSTESDPTRGSGRSREERSWRGDSNP